MKLKAHVHSWETWHNISLKRLITNVYFLNESGAFKSGLKCIEAVCFTSACELQLSFRNTETLDICQMRETRLVLVPAYSFVALLIHNGVNLRSVPDAAATFTSRSRVPKAIGPTCGFWPECTVSALKLQVWSERLQARSAKLSHPCPPSAIRVWSGTQEVRDWPGAEQGISPSE